jgi:hypothetical protein
MLWYKSWLETRWRFVIGLALLMVMAAGTVIQYPAVVKLLPIADAVDRSGPFGRIISQAAEVQREFRGFVWWQWFRQNLTQTSTLFAILLGSGGLLSRSSGGAALFTLSLPLSRNALLAVRAATGLAELLVLAFVPSLLIPLLSPAIGESYSLGAVLVHGVCVFAGGTVFFSLALLLSTVFSDLWRPLLLACAAAVVLAIVEQLPGGASRVGVFHAMTGEAYFRSGALPWPGLVVSAAASAALLFGARASFAHRDF